MLDVNDYMILLILVICQATLPSRATLTRLIAKISDEVRELLAGKLLSARRVSITTDAWTSKLCNNAYLGMYKCVQ